MNEITYGWGVWISFSIFITIAISLDSIFQQAKGKKVFAFDSIPAIFAIDHDCTLSQHTGRNIVNGYSQYFNCYSGRSYFNASY